MEQLSTLIIGAGIVGAGVAYALRDLPEPVYVLEAQERPGMGTSSRNSGVIHSGLYYPEQSLKNKLCREGMDLLYEFAHQHGVAVRRTGKYIVANNDAEVEHLQAMLARLRDRGLREVPAPRDVRAKMTVFSPHTGIVDIHQFLDALLERSGAEIIYHQKVTRLEATSAGIRVYIGSDEYLAQRVINCAGLQATDFTPNHRHRYGKGSYFRVSLPKDRDPPALVYPAVPKSSASLGVHLTRNIADEAYLGPDLEWVDSIYYGVEDAARHRFLKSAQTYLPWLEAHMLQPGYAGIRPKLSSKHFSDFTIVRDAKEPNLIHCLGIESPGITASMAIGDHVSKMLTVESS